MEKNSFKLLNIVLVESSFKRAIHIDFSNKNLKNNIDIDIQNSINENILGVTLTLKFNTSIEKEIVISSEIKMAGNFEFTKNTNISLDDFGNINAPAIIFPFIREHLSNTSMKAGIQPILLPPINFVDLAKKKKK
ncbi:protein-export chaperone SecB [Flavobacterium sp.]|uniref:protein-export chaperone SecB n=1 Tax=Flavobacterium sp. TaxID=239 RepID=UPI002FD8F7DD